MDFFKFTTSDFIACEMCNSRAVDIHHIDARGMGGSNDKDHIDNLMAVCRECHIEYGDKKEHKDWLKQIHSVYIIQRVKLN